MRTPNSLLLVLSLAGAGEFAAPSAKAQDPTPVASKITEVTVYADRARVVRAAPWTLQAGAMKVAFPKLPGWLDEGSVRVSLTPPDAAELVDVQVQKTFLARPDDAEVRAAESAVTELTDQLAALDDQAAALDAQMRQTDAIRVFSMEKWPKEAATREVKVEEYASVIKFIGDSMVDLAKAKRELDKRKRMLQPELNARQQKLADLRQRAQLEQRIVVVSLSGAREAQATLALSYLLPGTTWEPLHELRTSQDGATVTVASYALVTQTTGEDWDAPALIFSTQRPNATARIPELEALLVGSGHPVGRLAAAEGDTFRSAVSNFESQNSLWNGVVNNGRMDLQQDWGENVRAQKERQARAVQAFERVEHRGTTAQFPALSAQTVRSDGRLVRVPIGTARFTASSHIVAAPELSLNAVQTADLVNTGGQPLLPGKVQLYAQGAFIGTTETDFVAPGENFSVFLGMVDRLKLSRTLDRKRSSVSWSGKRKRMLAAFVVTSENLADKPMTFQLADRIPVSETEEIRVRDVKLQPETKPDVKGLLKWDVTLAPKEKKEFRIEYTIEYPAELPALLTPLPAAAGRSAAKFDGPARELEPQSAPAGLYRQIGDLEKQLKQ